MADATTQSQDAQPAAPKKAKAPKKKRPLWWRIVRIPIWIVGITLLLALLGVGGGAFYLTTDSGKERVRTLARERLQKRVNGTVEIESIDYELLGEIRLKGLTIKDEKGADAIALEELKIAPGWREIVGGEVIAIDALSIKGLHLSIEKYADGSSNLKQLFKPSDAEPSGEKKPFDKRVELRNISVEDVDVSVRSPDGTMLTVADVGFSGHANAAPATKDAEVVLTPLSLGFFLEKPESQGGLKLGLRDLKSGVTIDLKGGKGTAKLDPLTANLSLSVPGKIDKAFPIGWEGISFEIGDGDLGLSLERLALGAVSLASVQVKGHVDDGSLAGDQAADIVGLKLDAAKVNDLLGKEILRSDIDLEAHLTGTATQPRADLSVQTKAGAAKISAKLDLSEADRPKHDISLELSNIDTSELLSGAVNAPPIKLSKLEVRAEGSGKDATSAKTTAEINASGIVARGVTVDRLHVKANVDGPKIVVDRLEVDGLDQHATARGTFDRDSKAIDVTLDVEGDVGVALAKLREAGIPIQTNLRPGLIKLDKGAFSVTAKGTIGGAIDVTAKGDKLSILGGRATIDGKASLEKGDPEKGEKAVKLKGFDVSVALDGVLLSTILAMRGKRIPPALGFDAVLSLHAKGKGTITDPLVDATITATTLRQDKGNRATATIAAHVTRDAANVDLSLRDAAKREDVILDGHAFLPLSLDGEKKGIDPVRPLDVRLEMKRRPIGELVKFAPPLLLAGAPLPQHGATELALALTGSLSRPSAKVHLYAGASVLEPERPTPLQEVELDVVLGPGDARSPAYKLAADLGVRLEAGARNVLGGHVDATFPTSPLSGGAAGVKYKGHFDIGPGPLASLPAVAKLAKARKLGGDVTGKLDVEGTRSDLLATLELAATDLVKGSPEAPAGLYDANIKVEVKPDKTDVLVSADLQDVRLATIAGSLGLGGKGLLPRIKQGLDPSLDLTLDIPQRKLSSLAVVRPKLEKAPGNLSGSVKLGGSLKNPSASGGIKVSDVAMSDGTDGGAEVALSLDQAGLKADIGVGESSAKDAPVLLTATVTRDDLGKLFKPDGQIAIDLVAKADKAALPRLLPKDLLAASKVEPRGSLDWNMKAHAVLERKDGKTKVEDVTVDGKLLLLGNVPIPGTKRVYENVNVSLTGAGSSIAIDGLRLEERDLEVKNRWLELKGLVSFGGLRPKVDATIKANKWLLFGSRMIGQPDAPRGTLTIDATARAELDRPIKMVTVDVDKLAIEFPDRFEKAHQPEDLHVGDVVFLKDKDAPEIGKLVVPESVKQKIEADAAAKAPPPPADNEEAPAQPAVETGYDVEIHIAKGARLFQSPIDLTTGGDLAVTVRPTGTKMRGKLVMSKGELSLGGVMHPLKEGSLSFDEEHPKGWIDLSFKKPMAAWKLRNISEASAGKSIDIHMFGPITDRKTVLSGAGSPGALYDLLSMHNVGRERFYTEADLPETVSVEFPEHDGLLALSFISVNLPHLLFLDRVTAWSDANEDFRQYGRVEHFEAERYFADGKGRVRAAKRPASIGRSEAELEVDYLFYNDPRVMFGIGGTAGSRGGGGPGVVFEWSSKD
ncbi:MAG: hypothetical protein HOW73_06650 [Polyangiaceae bacterium]|nr:hypothetical protein [Polyangiaceae bacterium]